MNNAIDDIELLDSPKYIPLEHAASHTYELAEKWGRQVRNAIRMTVRLPVRGV